MREPAWAPGLGQEPELGQEQALASARGREQEQVQEQVPELVPAERG